MDHPNPPSCEAQAPLVASFLEVWLSNKRIMVVKDCILGKEPSTQKL